MNVPALLLLAVGWSSATVIATLHDAAPQDPVVKKFSHAQHVGQVWFNLQVDEVWRDCRGCHRFDDKHLVSAPQQECDACHLPGNLGKQFTEGWKEDLGGYATPTRDAFRHHTHGMLECRECHLPVNLIKVNDFDIVTGAGQCARCHDPALVAKDDYRELKAFRWFRGAQDPATAQALGMQPFTPPTPDGFAQYVDILAAAFAGPKGGANNPPLPVGGEFDHYDHAGISCADCHAGIPGAKANEVGTGAIDTKSCGTCHQADAQGTAAKVAAGAKTVERPLWSLGAFSHDDHYRFTRPGQQRRDVATAAAYDALAKQGAESCRTCHVQDPDTIGRAARDFPFTDKKGKNEYLDCAACHDVPGWKTGETTASPLHDSTAGKAGDGTSGWNECARCHDFGASDFAATRPQVEVARLRERTFQFTTHTHPDITTPGIAKSGRAELQDCKKCHRATVPALASHIVERPFRHDTHLPAEPTAKDCQQCHPAATSAIDSLGLGVDGRTYSLQSCASCHWGGEVKEVDVAAAAPPKLAVAAFPHGPHVAAGASCTDCHEAGPGGRDWATKAKANDCTQCHDHRPGGPQAERLFGDEVKSCVACHHVDAAGSQVLSIPARRDSAAAATDPRYHAQQSVFAGFVDPQFHPLGRACTECHRAVLQPDVRWPGLRVKRDDHCKASSTSPHAGQASKEPEQCLRCHWKPMNDGRFEAGVFGRDAELMELRRNPSGAATRARFGNDPKGYPGTAQAGG